MVTPFRLAGGPACFQRFITWVLRDLLDDYVVVYVDDILIYSYGSLEDQNAKFKEVFRRLQKAGLRLVLSIANLVVIAILSTLLLYLITDQLGF